MHADYLFDELSRRPNNETDDQIRLNNALFAMDMTWVNHEDSNTHIGTSLRYQTHPLTSMQKAEVKMATAVSFSSMMVKDKSVDFQEFRETSISGWFKTVCLDLPM